MRIVSLASGSKGNAYCIISCGRVLLVDCGLSYREFRRRAEQADVPLDAIDGLLFTHSHDDHARGIATFHKQLPDVPLFANLMTAEAIAWRFGVDEADFTPFENGQQFSAGDFEVLPFSIPHDTSDPVGYEIRAEGNTYFHGTDIGTPLDSIGLHLANADFAVLESNHDPELLFCSGRPVSIIQRIAGPRGHLSNDQAAELVRRFASKKLKCLALAHLSEQCNAQHLAIRTMSCVLAELGMEGVSLSVLEQNEPVTIV